MKQPDDTRMLGEAPLTIETVPDRLVEDPTPVGSMYVRNNLDAAPPTGEWRVTLEGVARAGDLTVDDIFDSSPRVAMTAVLQCAGNGRGRLREEAPGVQWDLGGMACPEWSGVRLADLVASRGGVVGEPSFLTVLGGDAPADDPTRVERSLPIDEALERGLLVDRINDEKLPAVHGGPVRLVMPGYYAINSVKWVRRLGFTAEETDADIQRNRYRLVPPGQEPSLDHPPVWSMEPVAMILTSERTGPGVRVEGVAFGGGEEMTRVEISTDGVEWVESDLAAGRGRYSWRRFRARVDGAAEWVFARAVSDDGVQPKWSKPNRDGYAVTGWRELAHRSSL